MQLALMRLSLCQSGCHCRSNIFEARQWDGQSLKVRITSITRYSNLQSFLCTEQVHFIPISQGSRFTRSVDIDYDGVQSFWFLHFFTILRLKIFNRWNESLGGPVRFAGTQNKSNWSRDGDRVKASNRAKERKKWGEKCCGNVHFRSGPEIAHATP